MTISIRQQASGNSKTKTIFGLALGALLYALSISAEAQQANKIYRIGFLSGGDAGSSPEIAALREGLRELGYIEGKNLFIEYRHTERNVGRYPDLASELVRLQVDLIIGNGTGPTMAAKKATNTIPIVMASATDPVRNGLITSLARPGGNVTGLTNISSELGGKLLEILKEIDPKLSRVAIVIPGGGGAANKLYVKETEIQARELRVQIMTLAVRGPEDYDGVVQTATKERANALLSRLPPGTPYAHRTRFMDLATKSRIPVISGQNVDVEAGGLFSYGWDRRDLYRRAATYVDKILKGANPGDLPVEQPTKFELVMNLKTAKQIGLAIPQRVLARADRVIR